jgi:hypothetical protein
MAILMLWFVQLLKKSPKLRPDFLLLNCNKNRIVRFRRVVSRLFLGVLGLATGGSPVQTYQELVKAYEKKEISFSQVTSFNLDEYWGLEGDHPESYR